MIESMQSLKTNTLPVINDRDQTMEAVVCGIKYLKKLKAEELLGRCPEALACLLTVADASLRLRGEKVSTQSIKEKGKKIIDTLASDDPFEEYIHEILGEAIDYPVSLI